MAALARRIAECRGNIDRIVRLAKYPVTAIELDVSGADPDLLRERLARVAAEEHADIAVQPAGPGRRAKRLVVMDVDSTLIEGEVIELLAGTRRLPGRGRRGHPAGDARRAGLRRVAARAGGAA